MSRILLAILAIALSQPVSADSLSTYAQLTQVAVRGCGQPVGAREIVVCAARRADRWRAPIQAYAKGDPRAETVLAERNRLASEPPPPCGTTAFTSTCHGMVGVGLSMKSRGGPVTLRTPAD